MSNSLGKLFTVTSFGESHGRYLGTIIDGCPAGLALNETDIQPDLDRRKPGSTVAATPRQEADQVEILSGVFNGVTTGAPICLVIENRDADSSEYEKTRFRPRPGQADYTAFVKYGGRNDFRGGGRFSGRITATLVMGGAIARQVLKLPGIEILAHTVAIGGIRAKATGLSQIRKNAAKNQLYCADPEVAPAMVSAIEKAREEGDSLGGIIEGIALNVPAGLGEPIFDTVDGELAKALLAIPSVKGVEFGAGFTAAGKKGSENNDPFTFEEGKVVTATNNAGGILGGISNGMPIIARVAVKPTPSIAQEQSTIDLKESQDTSLTVTGRHDACIVPRAVVVVEAMMAITLCDLAVRAGLIPRVIK